MSLRKTGFFRTDNSYEAILPEANSSTVNVKLIRDLMTAIDQRKVTSVDALVLAAGTLPTYETFCRTLRKVPNNAIRDRYLIELKAILVKPAIQLPALTESEKKYIESRKLWSDVVSATDQINESFKMQLDVNTKLYKRLRQLGYENPRSLVKKSIKCLQNDTAIVVTFNANILQNGLSDFQLLNMFEKGVTHEDWINGYQKFRTATEESLFSRLDSQLSIALQQNTLSKPRYGVLVLLDKNSTIIPTTAYGKSFLVLKTIAKFNSLFLAKDSLNYRVNYFGDNPANKSLTPTTFHHLEILLLECSDKKLKSIIDWAITGLVPNDYSHQNAQFSNTEEHSYIEVLLPAVNILDTALVERAHIDQTEFKMSLELNVFSYYDYYHSNRFHLFAASYNNKSGDKAKSAILDEYKNELNKITNELQLEQFSERLTNNPRYKILCTSQGLATKLFNLPCHMKKTSSERALEKMIEHKRHALSVEIINSFSTII